MKINLHALYDNFTYGQTPKYIEWVKEGGLFDCYVDNAVRGIVKPNSIALLIEPRSIQADVYSYVEKHYEKFMYVFTHDDELLKLPNSKKIFFGGVYGFNDIPKTKNISIVSSDKRFCPLHISRSALAKKLRGVDSYGTFNGGKFVDINTYLSPYKFSIVIENQRSNYWFTEKLCNCFATNTIPIYHGAKRIEEIFDIRGIIILDDLINAQKIVNKLLANCEEEYEKRKEFIINNRKIVHKYICFEDWFYTEYREVLEGIGDDSYNNNSML